MALKDDIIGNKKICEMLEKSYAQDKLSHAYLFDGPEHIGKKTLALNFCKMILKSLDQDIEKNPDIIVITPYEEKKEIVVDQIRELEKNLSFSPFISEYKVAIIDQADKMTEEASNALLKTLEEPSKTTILILITANSGKMLETIRSRCQIFKFLPIKKEELRKHFAKEIENEKDLEMIMEVSGYKPGKIIEVIKDKDVKKELMDELEYLSEISKRGSAERMDRAEAMSECGEEKIASILDLWVFSFRNELISDYARGGASRTDSLGSAAKKINLIKKVKEDILTKNINIKLALENLILEI